MDVFKAENFLGRDFTHCLVRVTDATANKYSSKSENKLEMKPPIITRHLQDHIVHFGNQGLLECEIQTTSDSVVEWLHNGSLVGYPSVRLSLNRDTRLILVVSILSLLAGRESNSSNLLRRSLGPS